jgi:hypothetical protein
VPTAHRLNVINLPFSDFCVLFVLEPFLAILDLRDESMIASSSALNAGTACWRSNPKASLLFFRLATRK